MFKNCKFCGFSLVELLAVVTMIAVIGAIIVPRVMTSGDASKAKVDSHNRVTINAAVERWHIDKATWPDIKLTDIGADTNYFPNGLPTNPADGESYSLNLKTHRVE
jgi:general secretion pathway protein G